MLVTTNLSLDAQSAHRAFKRRNGGEEASLEEACQGTTWRTRFCGLQGGLWALVTMGPGAKMFSFSGHVPAFTVTGGNKPNLMGGFEETVRA